MDVVANLERVRELLDTDAKCSPEQVATIDRAVEASRKTNLPVMVDFGADRPTRPLYDLLTKKLRRGLKPVFETRVRRKIFHIHIGDSEVEWTRRARYPVMMVNKIRPTTNSPATRSSRSCRRPRKS